MSVAFFTEDIANGNDWWALERAVARILIHCGWKNVQIVGRSGDRGADIIGTREDGARVKIWNVQVKAVTGDNYVGIKAIQEVINAQIFYGADECAVATNGDFTRSASLRRDELNKTGFRMNLWNGAFVEGLLSAAPDRGVNAPNLRPYQKDIADKVISDFENGKDKTLFIVATGLGKTTIASEIADRLFAMGKKRILVLCHSQDLALQLEQGFWSRISKNIPTKVFFEGMPPAPIEGISVGLFQTLVNYLPGMEKDAFDVIIVDEAHHSLAPDFRRCIEYFTPKLLVGMTATPWRGDRGSLVELFGEPIMKVSLTEGMAHGYLSKVDYRIHCDNVDWEEVSKLSGQSLTIKDLNKRLFLPQRDDAVISRLKKVASEIKNPRIAIFSPSVEHAKRFAAQLSVDGIPCQNVSGEERTIRQKRLMDFAAGRLMAITSVDLLNEGIDVPAVNILVFLRATHSRRIFVQQLGRGLRLAPGKKEVVVLDFVSDIRRLAEILEFGREARADGEKYHNLYLSDGVVKFDTKEKLPFIDAWIRDVADLGESNDDTVLKFPE